MEELQFGQFGLSVVLSVIVGFIFKMLGGDDISERVKVGVMVGVGLLLGIVAIPYGGLPWTVVNIVNCLLVGIMAAAGASGLYSWANKGLSGSTASKTTNMVAYLIIPMFFLAPIALNGCAVAPATSQQQAVQEPTEVKIYKALDISATAYDTAMRSLNDLYINGVISKDAAQKAWDGGEVFYLAQKGAIKALRAYVQTKSATNEQELNVAIGKAGAALVEFTELVTPFLTRQLVTNLESAQVGLTKGGK